MHDTWATSSLDSPPYSVSPAPCRKKEGKTRGESEAQKEGRLGRLGKQEGETSRETKTFPLDPVLCLSWLMEQVNLEWTLEKASKMDGTTPPSLHPSSHPSSIHHQPLLNPHQANQDCWTHWEKPNIKATSEIETTTGTQNLGLINYCQKTRMIYHFFVG